MSNPTKTTPFGADGEDWALFTDLYQLTMAQGYWLGGRNTKAVFSMFFRDYPFKGGYAIACGLAQLADIVSEYRFSEGDVEYLSTVQAADGSKMFREDFLEYLLGLELSVDIDAVKEGTVVFPHEPIARVQGDIMQCQLLETALLNCINFQTLIATKAARVCQAAGDLPVAEFGLRRAQGLGGVWASRAAIVGGCASTSNVLAGKLFGIPVSGTHAHSWVMSFDDELEAFRKYVEAFPNNSTLLVDTYDVEQGIRNAITVGLEMKERGQRLGGIRIDSGDLTWLSKQARKMLDDAGLEDTAIVLSNDLDEALIRSILNEGAPVDAWGVGTKLATAYDQPSLGGVYKMTAMRNAEDAKWEGRMKISESAAKMTMPGVLNVRRYFDENGKLAGDMVFNEESGVNDAEKMVDPLDSLRRKSLGGMRHAELLVPFARDGKVVAAEQDLDVKGARARAKEQLSLLDETQLRMLNPHTYPVGLDIGLHDERDSLVSQIRRFDN